MSVLAHHDALTGIRNKLAYDQEVRYLDDELQKGETSFGIAIVDLNDLKYINDTYGHDCGDISIRTVCNAICVVFKHSPVFRIGGDEFAVILRNHDYQKVEELVAEFRQMMKKLGEDDGSQRAPWEKVSAAIGYALYDANKDKTADSVFRRADRDMYRQKVRMKGKDAVR